MAAASKSATHRVGAHVSISGGHDKALDRAAAVGCEVAQVFTKNNMQWSAPALDEKVLERYTEKRSTLGLSTVFAHASYLINLCAVDPATHKKSREALILELERSAQLDLPFIVLHPGAHMGAGEEAGLDAILESLEFVFKRTESPTRIALEITTGAGSVLGAKVEHLAYLIDNCPEQERLAVCLDTCHLFAAGYDLRTAEDVEAFLKTFRKQLPWKWVVGVHLNDSKGAYASRKDRHELIGQGEIGIECFRTIMQHKAFAQLPLCLETPKGKNDENDPLMLDLLKRLRAGEEVQPTPTPPAKRAKKKASPKKRKAKKRV